MWVAAGWANATAWYRNLVADPAVVVTCEGRTRAGIATEVTDARERLAALRAILAASGFVARLYRLDPATIADDVLASTFTSIPVVHIGFA